MCNLLRTNHDEYRGRKSQVFLFQALQHEMTQILNIFELQLPLVAEQRVHLSPSQVGLLHFQSLLYNHVFSNNYTEQYMYCHLSLSLSMIFSQRVGTAVENVHCAHTSK